MSSNWNHLPPPTYDAHSTTSYMTTTLTPYLQLPHLLSLTWLAYPILSLIFVAFRLQLSLADAQNAILGAKDDLLTSCKAAEEAATSAASMPRFMALATNKQYADAVNGSLNAARAALVLALTVMEVIINFIVDLYRSTFLCFLELVVRGGLAIMIGAVDEINQVLGTIANGLRTSIQNDISSANNVIKGAIDAINKINPFSDISVPQIGVPNLDALQNVSLPSSFTDALTNLNASIPSVAEIKDKIEDVIDTPFELLKQDINDTFANITLEPEGLPVPELTRLTFCTDLDTSVIDDIGRDFIKIAKIGVVIIILLALILIGLNCLLTWYKWRCMKKHLQYTREAWMTDPTMVHTKSNSSAPQITMSDHNLLMLHANSEHPLITKITNLLSSRFKLTPTQHTHTQWFFNYIFHAPALACFLIGFFGLLSVQIQLLALGPLVAKYQDRAASATADYSSTIATAINQSMYNQSSFYANEINDRVDNMQSTINNGLFGWVNGTTTTLNNTINTFYDDIQNAVTTVFGGTILEAPVNDFLKCFIGGKVDAIESALTFLHDNLHVDIPRVNQTVLVLSPDSVNEVSQPIAQAAIGGGNGDNEGLIGRLVNSYAASLRKERIMFAIFMGIWGFVILMGLCFLLWHSFGRPYLQQRGRRKWQAEQRDGLEVIGSFNAGGGNVGSAKDEKKDFHSFSPLPSPRASTFKPFWASRSNTPTNQDDYISTEAEAQNKDDNSVLPQVQEAPAKKSGPAKLLALGRKAIRRGERLQKDDTADEVTVPLSPSEPVSENPRGTAWYNKMGGLLARKNKEVDTPNDDFWDQYATEPKPEQARPKLQIYTQRGIDKYGPPPKKEQPKSRWSMSADPRQAGWTKILSPVQSNIPFPQEPEAPSYYPNPEPAASFPIRQREHVHSIPLDVGPVYEDSVRPAVLPIPLHNGFNNLELTRPRPPRHPYVQAEIERKQREASPPTSNLAAMNQPQITLSPPRNDLHKRGSSMGTTVSQWRVTNALPADSIHSSRTSLVPVANGNELEQPITPMTRLLTTTHARQSSTINPFITPFDDEHRVTIDHASGAGSRQSIPTNPFVHAL